MDEEVFPVQPPYFDPLDAGVAAVFNYVINNKVTEKNLRFHISEMVQAFLLAEKETTDGIAPRVSIPPTRIG